MKIVRLAIHGRVQGVGFRYFVEKEAEVSGLEGWARNRRDGSVEVVLAGDGAFVDSMIEALRRGPPVSRVDNIDVEAASADDLKLRNAGERFSVLRTA
jgi:acylphosphatase